MNQRIVEPNKEILRVEGLKTHFLIEEGFVPAVDGVDFSLREKETLAIVGESGSGKSVTALSILRLIPNPPGKIVAGSILYGGKDLVKA
ncbi:MAG: peptide/nickel transport system ATP-binding protein, partial [Spirochaetes bacterium]